MRLARQRRVIRFSSGYKGNKKKLQSPTFFKRNFSFSSIFLSFSTIFYMPGVQADLQSAFNTGGYGPGGVINDPDHPGDGA